MCASWAKDQKSEQLVNELLIPIKNQFHQGTDGSISGSNFYLYYDLASAIETHIKFDENIPEFEKFRLLQNALWDAGKLNNLKAKDFLGKLNKAELEYKNKSLESFQFISSLSVNYFSALSQYRLSPRINFLRSIPKQFDFKSISKKFPWVKEIPASYSCFKIPVKARSHFEAYEMGRDAIDLLRAIWNWFYFPKESIPLSSSAPRPLNFITLGPIHDVIEPTGKLSESFWSEDDFIESAFNISQDWIKLAEYEKKSRISFRKHSYGKDIEKYLRRFTRALDESDQHIVFLKVWQVLEKLADTNDAKYDQMIKRIVFIYPEKELHKGILNHLLQSRNSSVHDAHRPQQITQHIYQLLRYVKQIFTFHIQNPFRASSLSEAVSFMDENQDLDILAKKISKLQKVKKFQIKVQGK